MKKFSFIFLTGLMLALPSFSPVWAHANYVKSDPPASTNLPSGQPPSRVQVWFSESLEPKFSELQVLDNNRQRIDNGDSRVLPDNSQAMIITLKPGLPDGAYTVIYKTTSADDGHVIKNSFGFVVGAGVLPSAQTETTFPLSSSVEASFNFWSVALRWLNYLAGAMLIGGVAWRLFIWQPALHKVRSKIGPEQVQAQQKATSRGKLLLILALAGLGLGWISWLLYQVSTVSGTLFGGSALGDLLFSSRFGTIWLARLALIIVAALILLFSVSPQSGASRPGLLGRKGRFNLMPEADFPLPPPTTLETTENETAPEIGATSFAENQSDLGYWLLLVCGLLIILTTSLNAHAAALNPAWLFVGLDWLHLLATGLWVGGLFCLVLAMPPMLAALRPGTGDRTQLIAAIIANFSKLAIPNVSLLLVTGTIQAVVHLGSVSDLFSTSYGLALFIKLILVMLLLILGAYHQLKVSPALRSFARRKNEQTGAGSMAAGQLQFSFGRSVKAEAILALILLLVVGGLTSFGPPAPNATSGAGLTLRGQAADVSYSLRVDPAQSGDNNFDLTLTERNSGQPISQTEAVLLRLTMTDMEMGTQELELKPVANQPGQYQLQKTILSMSGKWRVELIVRREGKEDVHSPIEFKVAS